MIEVLLTAALIKYLFDDLLDDIMQWLANKVMRLLEITYLTCCFFKQLTINIYNVIIKPLAQKLFEHIKRARAGA